MKPGVFQITLKLFLRSGDHFLILKDARAQVGDLPGGRLGAGEIYRPWADSLRREIVEELGPAVAQSCRLATEPLFIFPHYIQESGYEALGIAYEARLERPVEIKLSDEHDWMDWVPARDYDPAPLFVDHLREAVLRFEAMVRAQLASDSKPSAI